MKPVVVQKAINVIKSNSWTSPIEFRYLDETSQIKFDFDRIGARKRNQVYIPKPWETLPYLAKDELGKIHVRGFLHDRVARNRDGSFSHPTSLSTGEIVARLGRSWNEHARNSPKTEVSHQRLVFSMSNEFHDTLVQAGRSPDMVLRGIIEKSMRSFQEKFHPGDSVGYSYGLHHDTDNLHAHVVIHPRTREGAFVGMSEQLQRKAARHAESRHKNQLRFVRETARHRAGQVLKQLFNAKEAAQLKNNFYSDRIFFAPRQSHAARTKNDFRPRTPADYQLEQRRLALAALVQQITAKKLARLEAIAGRNIAAIVRLRQPKWARLLEKAYAAKLFREMRELQAQRNRLYSEYQALRRSLLPDAAATKTVRRKKQAKPSAPSVTPRPPKPTVTLRSKPSKPKIRF